MRKLMTVGMCLLISASAAMAQSQFKMKWHCGKPAAQQSYEIGDVAGHSYGVAQGNCDAASSSLGEKTGTFTELQEIWTTSFKTRGSFNITTDSGDKMYYTYQAIGDPAKKTVSEKWTLVGGTGKHKGNHGSGTCHGKLNDDGSSDWDCSGTTSLGR